MRVNVKVSEPAFKPVEVKLLFETQEELDSLMTLLGSREAVVKYLANSGFKAIGTERLLDSINAYVRQTLKETK